MKLELVSPGCTRAVINTCYFFSQFSSEKSDIINSGTSIPLSELHKVEVRITWSLKLILRTNAYNFEKE